MSLASHCLLREVGDASAFRGPLPPARLVGWQNWRRDLLAQVPDLDRGPSKSPTALWRILHQGAPPAQGHR
eukprot:11221119-Lingulodinium_polyedra.AAC.1